MFPEQCAKYLHDKFRIHSELTVRELMVILKRIGIKTIKIHNNGKIYDVFFKRDIDGIQDFEFLNNLYEYRKAKQIRDEWNNEPLIDYDPVLSDMQNASDELLRQDDVYYTNETKNNNMKKDNKKALYESIMTSVAKEVKKVLNERQILSEEEKLSRRIGNKLSFRIYGGDWNDILDAMENNNPEEAREICRVINRSYRTRIFSGDEIEFMINNWELCKESAYKIRKEKIEKFYHTGILPEHQR